MSLNFHLTTVLPASAEDVYNAWLDSEQHALMINSDSAVASHIIDADHQSFDGYITGKNLKLFPGKRIVQSWRNADFKEEDPDSLLTITLEEQEGNTLLTLIHTNVPDTEAGVEQGWIDYYFEPMKAYFLTIKKA